MGNVYQSIPTELANRLRRTFGLTVFIETGLGQGSSALWAEERFHTVISIEIDPKQTTKFKASHPFSRVEILEGDSGKEIQNVITCLVSPAMFWLDGHTDDYAPILDELMVINTSPLPHVIMIDDWRMFGTCPAWPSKESVVELARNGGARDVYEVDDVLVAVPC